MSCGAWVSCCPSWGPGPRSVAIAQVRQAGQGSPAFLSCLHLGPHCAHLESLGPASGLACLWPNPEALTHCCPIK